FIGIEYTFSTSATEPNGDQIQYGWDWNGDGTVDYWTDFYSSGQTVEASNSWDSVGTYNVKVKAKDQFGDESGWSTANQIQIGIGDPPNIPLTPSGPDNGNHKTVYSFSTSTTDPNLGDKLFYKFDWDDGTTSQWLGPYESGETMSTDYAWNEPGTFHIRVKAKDLAGSESDWSDTKTVIMENTPPSKPLKPSGPTYGIVGTRYIFSTSATDAENDQLEYLFSWGDGTDSGWTPFNYAEHAWFEPGDFQVRVKARDTWDESEWSNPSTLSIEAGSLTVTINVEPNSAIIHEEIQFSAIVSDGTEPYTYNWDFGDGNKSNEQNLIYTYEQPGDYFVSLSVEDNAGAYGSNFITITINITNPPEKPAIIDGPESAVIKQPSDFTFSSVDPNGDDVYIFVDWGDESNGTWEGPFESGEELVLSHAWEYEGVYTIRAKAKDTYDFESDWSQPFEITIGWQNAFIIGTINNKIETNNQFEFAADFLIYVGSDPFKIGIYKSGEHFVVSDDYRGIFGNNFILGKFEVGYIQG
ncbi:MAG: PKD domain-containing protein, partial [Candidatus Thermoplasmatota archaeon]|nr:PKD domain-containing protein [Candidatus Thermoplasmatota archaeon]